MANEIEKDDIVFFDVCNTLYYSNTTADFIEYYLRKRNIMRFLICRILRDRRFPLFLIMALYERYVCPDAIRDILLLLMRGKKRKDVAASARMFVTEYLSSREIAPAHQALKAAKAAGSSIYLLSSSIDAVVEPIAARLGVQFHASTLEYHGNRCAGKLQCNLRGRKHQIAKRIIDTVGTAGRVIVFTDNLSDRGLLDLADSKNVIIQSNQQRKIWNGFAANYIAVQK